MQLNRSAALVPRLVILDNAGSTNDELGRSATADPAGWPDFSVVVTDDQRSGRGRMGRRWVAPPGKMLAISVLLRPVGENGAPLPPAAYGWLPLLGGVAMARAIGALGVDAAVKWPNDVLIGERKVCGVLSELLPGAAASAPAAPAAPANQSALAPVILGAGVNLTLTGDELPVDTATSLLLAGVDDPDPDAVLAGYLTELSALYRRLLAAGGDAGAGGIADAVREACQSLGRSVRVELPDGESLIGAAVDVDDTGRLVVEVNGRRTAVAAGDVRHLRY